MGYVIVNGDDFGWNERCSCAIAKAFSDGLITDTTVMANGAFFDGAVALAGKQGFDGRIGIHFNLTEGVPLTAGIGSLSDFVSGGRFVKRYADRPRPLCQKEQDAVSAELEAQVMRLQAAGVRITHADSHHYIHQIGYLAPLIAQVCRRHGITKIRLSRNIGDAAGSGGNHCFWREQGFATTEHFGRMSDILDGTIPDNLEIMVHPDFDQDGILIDRRGMKNGFPVGEELRRLSAEQEVVLRSYCDL